MATFAERRVYADSCGCSNLASKAATLQGLWFRAYAKPHSNISVLVNLQCPLQNRLDGNGNPTAKRSEGEELE